MQPKLQRVHSAKNMSTTNNGRDWRWFGAGENLKFANIPFELNKEGATPLATGWKMLANVRKFNLGAELRPIYRERHRVESLLAQKLNGCLAA